ncbi:MAG: SRPBCC domain-containing protein [Melioribacteraceae bacterium]
MKTGDMPIIVEQTFNSTAESVWASITELEEMKKWYFENIPSFKPEVGFETQFNIQSGERNFLHFWKVTHVRSLKLIRYEWRFDGYSGKSSSSFELFNEGNSTKLRLTVEIQEDFPDDIPEFRRESCIEGWRYFINNRLTEYLNNIQKK